MLRNLLITGTLLGTLASAAIGNGQALPAATANGDLQIGVGPSYAKPDYGMQDIKGVSAWFDLDLTSHFGFEGTIHYIALVTPTDIAENTYAFGPRVYLTKGRFRPYGKVIAGLGSLVIQETEDNQGRYSGTYFMYAVGVGLDLQATRHIVIRPVDVEYQQWPHLGNGLTPYVATAGIAYRFR